MMIYFNVAGKETFKDSREIELGHLSYRYLFTLFKIYDFLFFWGGGGDLTQSCTLIDPFPEYLLFVRVSLWVLQCSPQAEK